MRAGPSTDGVLVKLPSHWPMLFSDEGFLSVQPPNIAVSKQGNPNYAERVGAHWENTVVPRALASLNRSLGLNARQRAGARKALNQYIHDWLGLYVDDGVFLLPEHQALCLAELDEGMRRTLTPAQFDAWPTWRDTNQELRFLIRERVDPRAVPDFSFQRLR